MAMVCGSALRSPRTGRVVARARVDLAYADIGTEVELEVGRLDRPTRRIPARVVAFPHYDPKKERPRA